MNSIITIARAQEGFFSGAHFDFEKYVASDKYVTHGHVLWVECIRKAPVMPIFEPGGFTRENREMGGLGIY
jgi:hypothetical protein